MKDQKLLFALVLLAFLMSAPAGSGNGSPATEIPAEGNKRIQPAELNRKSTILAENKSQAAGNEGRSINENADQAPDSETAGKEKGSTDSKGAETKPLKTFKPSEEIPADQAVDFPVDI